MVKSFLKKNAIFILIIFVLSLLIDIIVACIMYYFIGINGFQFVHYFIVSSGIMYLMFLTLSVGKYGDWICDTIKYEINNSFDYDKIVNDYKIKRPFKKEIDIGEINKSTSYISNVLNLLEGFGIIVLMFIIFILNFQNKKMNITAVIIGVMIPFFVYVFHLILEVYNDLCIEACELLSKYDALISDGLDMVIYRNKVKLRRFLIVTMIIIILNLLFVIIQ